MAIKNIVNTLDKGLVDLSTFPCRGWVKELCEYRTFKSLEQLQNILMVVDVSEAAYDRGLGCPRDARVAIETIKSLPKFEASYAVMTSDISGKDLYEKLHEAAKKGMILYHSRIEDPQGGSKYWMAEVIDRIEEVA